MKRRSFVKSAAAAFSLFSGQIDWLKWVSLIVSLGLVGLGLFSKGLSRWEQVGYGCVLAGAAGNGIDRFVAGYVVDFVDIRIIRFAIFNIADVAINVGLVCLGLFSKGLSRWEQVGYGCVLAGAAGNGIDRFVAGYVVDFVDALS